jgi:histidine ammonia-lyase
MLLRANALAKGNSGARVETVELLLALLDRGVLPVVPSRGSVGASGDLAPLAHLALPLVGEGEAWVEDERFAGAEALARVGLEPVQLAAKEGLSLVNGTQFMAATLALAVVRARRLALAADIACALSVEALQGSRTSFLPADPRAPPFARPEGGGPRTFFVCSKARRSSRRTAGATRCRTRTRSAARRRCTAPRATSSSTRPTRSASS